MNVWRRGITLALAGGAALAMGAAGVGVAVAEPPPVAQISDLTGQSTSVALDSGFVSALGSLQVAPSPSGKATVKNGVAKFPITGGNVTVYKPGDVDPYVQGKIMHQGSGLKLTKGGTVVTLQNFVVDPGKPAILTGEVLANGKVVAPSTTLFDLDGSTLKPITTDAGAGTATLTGTTVKLSDGAAKALNGAFKTDALKGGITIGIATIVVNVKSGQPSQSPSGGVASGGGSTAGLQDAGLFGAGGVALLAAAGAAVYALRRRGPAQSSTRG